jgi:pyruvate/2-oxoglutarate dehydrogenase complex dihydrolipoamide acyltransferase (E2) component
MTDVVLDPLLAESVEAGATAVIDQWLVCEGDHVSAGQTLARADLVHNLVDVKASHAGIVEEIRIPAGETFGPGTVLARLISA